MTLWAEKPVFPEQVRQNAADPDQIRSTWTTVDMSKGDNVQGNLVTKRS